jgi:non-specific serine/threonine protein kinase
VTLTGSGGCGKTRLSLQVAADVLERFPDGVWFVELAPLTDGERVPRTVAAALGLREEPGRSAVQTLIEYARTRAVLLVLDNCEHLVSACASLADELLKTCPRVRILATSREALQVAGERTYRIPSLSLPDPKEAGTEETLVRYEAVRLFVERARQARPEYRLQEGDSPVVARICRRVDGIPLALELAAARMRAMTAEQIAQRLDDRFRLLAGGSRTAPPRHQTLRATLDWSYDLLSETERLLLRRLAVFVGDWSLEAAERVCAGEGGDAVEPWEVLDLLTSLVDKSLVVFEEAAGEGRYRLLETVRQYGQERLSETGEWPPLCTRHLDYFLDLAEGAEPHLRGPEQATWLSRLEAEHDNLLSALEWAVQAPDGRTTDGLRLCAALGWFWLVHGKYSEGQKWCAVALSDIGAQPPPKLHADVLLASARLTQRLGDYPAAQARYEESLALYRALGDRQGIAVCTGNLGNLAYDRGEREAAKTLYAECLALGRELGDSRSVALSLNNLGIIAVGQGDYATAENLFAESLALHREKSNSQGIADALGNLGDIATARNDFAAACRFFEQSLALHREVGYSQGIALALGNLGRAAFRLGDYATARARHAESLTIYRDLGDRSNIASALEGFAGTLSMCGDPIRAARLFGAAESLREEIGAARPEDAREEFDRSVSAARGFLGEAAFASNQEGGRSLTWEDAVAEALLGLSSQADG